MEKKNQINSLQLHFILIHTGIYDYGGGGGGGILFEKFKKKGRGGV